MQVNGAAAAHTLRRAGPSINKSMISAPLELTQAVKPEAKESPANKMGSRNSPPASCKPEFLLSASKPNQSIIETPSGEQRRPLKLIGEIRSEIDAFLDDVKDNGYMLRADESTIADRLEELESREHILSPIAETPEVPGGFNPLTLTYSLPKADLSTKPCLAVALASERLELPAKNPARERPVNAWRNLGSRKYHFVDEDKVVRKPNGIPSSPTCLSFLTPSTPALHGSMAANHATNRGLPSAYGDNTQYNPQAGGMADVVTVTTVNTVSMWPATTIGTSISFEPLATNCFVVGMQLSCIPNPPPAGAAATPPPVSITSAVVPVEVTTATAVLTLTSHPLPSTETAKLSTTNSADSKASSTPSTSTSSIAPIQTDSLVPGFTGAPDESNSGARTRQIGVALGISFALLVIALLVWLVFAWKTKRYPFRKPDNSNEEAGLVMEKIDRSKEAHLTGGAAIFPRRRKSSRPQSYASSIRNRPTSSMYSQELNATETKSEAPPYEAWTDTMSNASQQQKQVTRNFIDEGLGAEDPASLPAHKPFSGTSFGSLYGPTPPTPPPTSPLPPLPLAAALHMPSTERRSMVYQMNFRGSPVIAQERDVLNRGPYQSGLDNNDARESHWSLQRMGSRSPVGELNDEDMQVPSNPYDRVTGLEYLYSMPKHRSGERE
ncbi:hypothetical protein CERZMDRAFT_82293 [Cercospora zeae-maydis SCOH1-5]|uniref:Uncharacterized protein n=1 Tax=Cercospora zeae-maydis SCOH1-5 TaxID=717836 RepID=A0A6A6FPI4_9PEZI|nr:hypothetical protein CERZMDRAFT_82293 [Cercospora zeae-maydis SCOH1-5]